MKLSVIVPTFRRVDSLLRCLDGLRQQTRPADELLIIIRDSDQDSSDALAHLPPWPEMKVIRCIESGQVIQLNAGLDAVTGDIVAITDDDAVPRPDWLLTIEAHFVAQPDLGGVGGRDYVEENGKKLVGDKPMVGTIQWFGRVVGNHHLGSRLVPSVDCLKGVNMSYRMSAVGDIRFDTALRGKGAQTGNDWAFSMAIHKRGWRLLYDPAVAVDHYPAVRHDADQRGAPTLQAIEDSAFNVYLSLFQHLRRGMRRRAALTWARLVGIENNPGVVRGLIYSFKRDQFGKQKRQASKRAWKAAQCDYDLLRQEDPARQRSKLRF